MFGLALAVEYRAAITAQTAQRLEKVFGSPAKFWLEREAEYQAARQRRQELDRLRSEHGSWLKELPHPWMTNKGWVKRWSHKGRQIAEYLKFFEVGSVETWRKTTASMAAFRASPAFEKKKGAVAAWLCEGEKRARSIECRPFDAKGLKQGLPFFRQLTNETDPIVFVPNLRRTCAENGLALILLDYPPGCPVSGATKWLTPNKAMLMLSLRHKANDHLWFSFFHEIGHILLHGKKMIFIEGGDGLDSEQEREADEFARDVLIPPADAAYLAELGERGRISKSEVVSFAKRIGIAPGIVVGRMQKEGWLPHSHLNGLKVRYEWQE